MPGLDYFKDNVQTEADQDEFNASQYYYNRDDLAPGAPGQRPPPGAHLGPPHPYGAPPGVPDHLQRDTQTRGLPPGAGWLASPAAPPPPAPEPAYGAPPIPRPAAFQMSDFPSLGGAPFQGSDPNSDAFSTFMDMREAAGNPAAIGANFNIQTEDFPALPGSQFGGQQVMGLGEAPMRPPQGFPPEQPRAPEARDAKTKFGLLGLLDVIRMTNVDLNTLALGSDLTTLGLNLNSAECLYSTFASPWAEAPCRSEPQFALPMCYYMQPPPLKTSHLSKFQLETLFYIFYAMPKDVLQAYAAQELYNRDWSYHQDLKLWFKRGSSSDGLSTTTNQYIFFDINAWECRLHAGAVNLASGLLREEDVRVKFAAAS